MAKLTAQLARLAHRVGCFFSIENPKHSLLWKLTFYQALLQLDGVDLVFGDQCPFGGGYLKPGMVNECSIPVWVESPLPPDHTSHEDLFGHYFKEDGARQWCSSLGAEY